MFSKNRLITVGMTLAILYGIFHVEAANDFFTGKKGWFS